MQYFSFFSILDWAFGQLKLQINLRKYESSGHFVRLLGGGIFLISRPLVTQDNIKRNVAKIKTLSGIWINDHVVSAVEDNTRPRPRGHWNECTRKITVYWQDSAAHKIKKHVIKSVYIGKQRCIMCQILSFLRTVTMKNTGMHASRLLVCCLTYSSALKTEEILSSETSGNVRATWWQPRRP